MNFHFLWHDIQHGLFHLDKGMFYTAKELFTRPGHSIREYIEGKRVKHFRPVSLVIVLAGIYGLLYHYFHINMLDMVVVSGSGQQYIDIKNILQSLNEWMGEHYAVVALIQLPIAALGTYLAFFKQGYNYIEHFILNAFLTAQSLLVHIVLFPFTYIFNKTPALNIFSGIENIISILLVIWVLMQFFNKQKKAATFWYTLLSFIIYIILYAILFIATAAVIYFFRLRH